MRRAGKYICAGGTVLVYFTLLLSSAPVLRAQSTPCVGTREQVPGGIPPEASSEYNGEAPSCDAGTGSFHPVIPETWDDLREFDVPLANPAFSPDEVSWDFYYRVPWRPIFKSYPVYAPGREPPGYFEWLKRQEPQVLWGIDDEGHSHKPALATESDWRAAGAIVFDSPIAYDTAPWGTSVVSMGDVRDAAWYAATGTPVGADGVMPYARYVIRKRGMVELGQQSCGMCHTRVMPDGSVVKGAQGNFPFERAAAYRLERLASETADKERLLTEVRHYLRSAYSAPWITPDPAASLTRMSLREIAAVLNSIPPGVIARTGSSLFAPIATPDLIGLKDRRYLDHTGLAQQSSLADLMRYAALNQDMKGLACYGRFIPDGADNLRLPAASTRSRYLDEELYALTLFIYSLGPPPNPNQYDSTAAHGAKIFAREGCKGCHTPPLYSNNKLTLARGFTPSAEILRNYDVLLTSVGTDPTLALGTRRGTGFYKVPLLRGLWYRGMFPHDGSCATLEDWFDPQRLRDDHVPTGFKGYGIQTRAVKGHPFGLDLSLEDRNALIAFLKTL